MAAHNIPGYEILSPIGDGATSVVYKARQTSLNRIVAIKMLRPERLAEPAILSQFRLEANSTATLKHPNILQIYEAGESQGVPFFVMEHVAGYSVESWVHRKGRLPESDTLTLADTVCRALKYAWDRAGLIHADLKPGNLLVDEDGLIKVADFSGLSRNMLGPESDILRDMTIGTPNYMSPEQVKGFPDLDFRADIYGLGCVLYHLLSGRIPFFEFDPRTAMRKQVEGYLPDIAESAPDVSLPTILLVERMLIKNRDMRYATWDAALADVLLAISRRRSEQPVPPAGSSTMRRTTPLIHPESSPGRIERKALAPAPPGAASGARSGPSRGRKTAILLAVVLLLSALNYVLLFHPSPDRKRMDEIRSLDLDPGQFQPTHEPEPPPLREAPGMRLEMDRAAAETEAQPEALEERAPQAEFPEENDFLQAADPAQQEREAEAAYGRHLDLMQEVFALSVRRQWGAAQDRLRQHGANPPDAETGPWVERQVERIQWILHRMDTLADSGAALQGIVIESPTGFAGEIVGIRNRSIRIQQAIGGGHAQTDVDLLVLRPQDLLMLLGRLDPAGALANEVMIHLGLCDMESAAHALRRAQAAGLDTAELEAWHDEWRRLIQDIQARISLAELRTLVVQSRFEEATALLDRMISRLGEGEVLRRFRRAEIAEISEALRRESQFLRPELSGGGTVPEPEPAPDDDPAFIRLFTIGELSERMIAWHGRPVRLRFRARAEVEQISLREYRTQLIGEDGQIDVLFDEEAVRWIRALPLMSVRNRDQFVFARVNAEHNRLELLGRTRRLLIGHRGSEYAW